MILQNSFQPSKYVVLESNYEVFTKKTKIKMVELLQSATKTVFYVKCAPSNFDVECLTLKWISDTVLSNFRCHVNLADTAANLVHNTKKLFNVKIYY